MKRILTPLLLFAAALTGAFAQETPRSQSQQRQASQQHKSAAIELTTRAEQMNRTQSVDISDAKWTRIVYRYLDLSKEANAPLYYPVIPESGRMNLFTMMFKLLSEKKIKAFEYLDGREDFADEYVVDFNEFLDRFGIFYENQNGNIVVNDVDIPANEVQGYYVKEAYYFETGTSNYGIKTLAVCPIIFRQGDYESGTTRYPLFWIRYDDLRPYALRMPIMTSSLNNTMSATIDDFFRRHTYAGEIYKTANLRNLAISQYITTPEAMKAEQEKIEKQLKDFEDSLWVNHPDSLQAMPAKKSRKAKRAAAKKSTSSTQPTNSMRDRRY